MTSDWMALQVLQRGLETWRPAIERATRGRLSLVLHAHEGLKLEVSWEQGEERGIYAHVFLVPPLDTRACTHARAIIRKVLERRGVFT